MSETLDRKLTDRDKDEIKERLRQLQRSTMMATLAPLMTMYSPFARPRLGKEIG